MSAAKLAAEARACFRQARGDRAGTKTATASFNASLRGLEARARAWDQMSAALDANAYDGKAKSSLSAADVCAIGFELQEGFEA